MLGLQDEHIDCSTLKFIAWCLVMLIFVLILLDVVNQKKIHVDECEKIVQKLEKNNYRS